MQINGESRVRIISIFKRYNLIHCDSSNYPPTVHLTPLWPYLFAIFITFEIFQKIYFKSVYFKSIFFSKNMGPYNFSSEPYFLADDFIFSARTVYSRPKTVYFQPGLYILLRPYFLQLRTIYFTILSCNW